LSPEARNRVRWLFNAGWLLVIALPPITCRSFLATQDWLFPSLAIACVCALLLVVVTSIIGLFDVERRAISVVSLICSGGLIGAMAIAVAAISDLLGAVFGPNGVVVKLFEGLAHIH
jgi:hypothetical protein